MIIEPEQILTWYRQGAFPVAPYKQSRQIELVVPEWRGIIPIDNFRVSKNVLRQIRNKPHQVRYDHDFLAVIKACAARPETWISKTIIDSYYALFQKGYAHSVEIYDQTDTLIGGLYGVHIGAVFFGESMFKRKPEADKFALYYCHQKLVDGQFILWDTQYYTPHLGTFGAIEILQSHYLECLSYALKHQATF